MTYAGIALARLPWIRIDRPSAAFLGAVAMVLFGVLSPQEAVNAIDWGTIALLLGMMVLVSALSQDGHLVRTAAVLFGGGRSAAAFLVRVVAVTAVASALLVNDTAVLVLTPLVLVSCAKRGLPPVPFLIAEAMASNIGSVPSVVGNPQNVLVALQSGISFQRFALHLLPVGVLSCAVLVAILAWLYRSELAGAPRPVPAGSPTLAGNPERSPQRPLGRLSPVVLALVILGFATSMWTGLELPLIALVGAGAALLTSPGPPGRLFAQVDWVLLLFFASLFVVMGGVASQQVFADLVEAVRLRPDAAGVMWVHGAALAISQVISNVPFTMLMLPVLSGETSGLLWLSLASGATLAGNLTLVGAVANLIVAQVAEREGVRIDFWEFARAGVFTTLVTVALSVGLLVAQWRLGWLS